MVEVAVRRVPEGEPRADAATRLELARGLLRRMENASTGVRPVDPGPPAEDDVRVLPVAAPLARLLPAGGLRRGTTVAVAPGSGATSLLLALVAEASGQGAWVGVIGRPDLGLVAAAEAGVRLRRLALVPHPGADLLAVTIALLDGMDVVAVAGAVRAGIRAADRQRLAARARQRGAVLLSLGPWPGADVELGCTSTQWRGLDAGAGRLRERGVRVQLRGRGLGPGRDGRLLLPGLGGRVGPESGAVGPTAGDAPAVRVAVAG